MRAWKKGLLCGALAIGVGWAASPVLAASPHREVPTATTAIAGAVVAAPGSQTAGYATPEVVITQGQPLTFVNLDVAPHSVTAVDHDANNNPLFDGTAVTGSTVAVKGADQLLPGTYGFYCRFHPNMRGTLIVEGGPAVPSTNPTPPPLPTFGQPLRIPQVLTGPNISVPVTQAAVQIMPTGPPTVMDTYGGSYPGPTIEEPTGTPVSVTFDNELPAPAGDITVHLHGDHHSSDDDGQPNTDLIAPGGSRTYTYPLTESGQPERAAFDFYHDHRMGVSGRNVWNGLEGMFITSDPAEDKLGLPTGGYDVPLLVADRSFDANNQLTEPFASSPAGYSHSAAAPPGDSTVGDHILVNGTYLPYLDVSTHLYRLRLLNGSNFQSYDFALSNGQALTQVGTGAGLLPAPVPRTDILLGPAQRADVIVDFRGDSGRSIQLDSIPRTSGSDNTPGGIGTVTASIMQFRVDSQTADTSTVPATLSSVPALPATAPAPSMVWAVGLGGDSTNGVYWTVNGHGYDPTRIDYSATLGSTQTWLLVNLSPITHYIHIHEEHWRTVAVDGQAPPAYLAGYEDTWRIDPGHSVEVEATFTDYAGVFMIHCHMLDHEDNGMMAQFAVEPPGSTTVPAGYTSRPSYPPGGPTEAARLTALTSPTRAVQAQLVAYHVPSTGAGVRTGSGMSAMDMTPPAPPVHQTPWQVVTARLAAETVAIGLLGLVLRRRRPSSVGWNTKLTVGLGGLWLLDAILQSQPYMFSRHLADEVIKPVATGNPSWVAGPVAWTAHLASGHPALTNAAFVAIQLLLAVGIFVVRTRRLALCASIPWAVAVWFLGEGAGGLLTGTSTPWMGAPGAALLYALVAGLLLLAGPSGFHDLRAARATWSAVWGSFGVYTLWSATSHPGARFSDLAAMAGGEPAWLGAVNAQVASALGHNGIGAALILGVVMLLIGLAPYLPALQPVMAPAALFLALAWWVFAQDFGGILTGTATDPGSGLLLALFALGFWPAWCAAVTPERRPTPNPRLEGLTR